MSDPQSYQEWLDVSLERASDASAMLEKRSESVGPIYMAGYAVECVLKAHLQRNGKKIPKGPNGHDLERLWRRAGFTMRDLGDDDGRKAFFMRHWSTDMRYHIERPSSLSSEDLIQGAKQISGFVKTRMRRRRRG